MTFTLDVQHLDTQFVTRDGLVKAVDDVSFAVPAGKVMGLVGESGSGKSMTAYSIMGLVDAPGEITGGKVLLNGVDLRSLPPSDMRRLRGNRIAMIFQDPMMTLNPVLRIDTQMTETIRAHRKVTRVDARAMACAALQRVGIAEPEQRLLAYPHQFSGGMRQRVAIAIALLNEPDLIICDEPTTALDVTIQGQILFEMQALCRESGTALIWISHDLAVVASLADEVAVMYAGRIVEHGSTQQVLMHSRHPYTHGLIAAAPARNHRGQPLHQIPGAPPSLRNLPTGCAFRPRCGQATEACSVTPEVQIIDQRALRCFHPLSGNPGQTA
ncbi:ABC transporter ATP-binding protein [Herbaspirillum sp. RTI4]|uniref:ABC transporter ATP-binding protein n=1 Tax=Herbaspirillum sp. RTI4 TaxID=3048640 RepID=UPI002AB5CA2E|nr:ABC transporter ATP-binding protein [Herbaspirillum sp. RTI4]MDY7577881.1 ABC transporter ATP-binding protein [Herbaspirillum sp. RTI4]MEA9981673.1 ABC transporter ATP-binding protein [Herbaspirillum sp. RTI4]